MSKNIDLEFFDKDCPNGERRLSVTRKKSSTDLEFSMIATREIRIVLEEKEALELASQIFRNVLGLY